MKSVKKIVSKTVRKPSIAQTSPRLALFVDTNFAGTRQDVRGTVAIRNMESLFLNDNVESLRFEGSSSATLVIFRSANYQGGFRIIRGPTNIADLRTINFEDDISSLIMSSNVLTQSDVQRIQSTRLPPAGYAEVLRKRKKR